MMPQASAKGAGRRVHHLNVRAPDVWAVDVLLEFITTSCFTGVKVKVVFLTPHVKKSAMTPLFS